MNDMVNKTHYRKAFNSPYLSSADIVGPTLLTIKSVKFEPDRTKKTKDNFNTAYFSEKELRPGEALKPMILNATNSKLLHSLTGSTWIEDWNNLRVNVYVDANVRFGRNTVEGLRLSIPPQRAIITPDKATQWTNAVNAYKRDGNFGKVLARADISPEHQQMIIDEVKKGNV